jgi:hypothetical protein
MDMQSYGDASGQTVLMDGAAADAALALASDELPHLDQPGPGRQRAPHETQLRVRGGTLHFTRAQFVAVSMVQNGVTGPRATLIAAPTSSALCVCLGGGPHHRVPKRSTP